MSTEDYYVNTSGRKEQPPALPAKATGANDDWDILRGYLNMSIATRDGIAEDQIRQVNPSNVEMMRAAIIGRVPKFNFEATKALIKLMAYEGFNPITVMSEMSARADRWNQTARTESWKLALEGMEFNITEKADLPNDVLFLCNLFLTRGNNLRKIISSIEKTIKTPLMVKLESYGIKSDSDEEFAKRKRSEKIDLNSKDETLSRIAVSFPQVALSVVHFTGVRAKVDLTCMSLQYRLDYGESNEAPAILTHGLIPSLLPKADNPAFSELKRFSYFFNAVSDSADA